MECWIKRLLVLKEAKIGEEEINNVRNAIIDALGPDGCNVIDDMEIRYNDGNVYFHYIDGRTAAADLLSDGYRRLINIVMDIAFRSALLNKAMYGDQSYKHTNGTVIIDEIDEHLHPALQVCILKALQMTFPKIQFIVSTHSPLVISSVETRPENIVYKLEYSDGIYSHKEINAYGLDSNLILEEKVGVLSRVPLIDSKLKLSLDYISKRKLDDAKREIDELEKLTDPNQPELVKLRAILNRIEAIGV
jgi:predicted ATP-binding protein involved in virulence